jgi:hypothetical protein
VVVDGSNIATEGRSAPSLKQLNEAVLSYINENPDAKITVVVDASFGHRIDKREVSEFDEAVNNNELVTPPAGAIGRGDAFVLAIADKVKASIISNDSYQEFHGEYPWLFDQGRLLGGKPVPHVGWIFVERTPVRGPTSKKAVRASRATGEPRLPREQGRSVKKASGPMPVPKTPPPGARLAPRTPDKPVNDVLSFLSFVEKQPVGSKVKGVVDSYSAHGAYVRVGEITGYVPLRLLGSPAPRSAREAVSLGDTLVLVVAGYTPSRRSVELGVPDAVKAQPVAAEKPTKKAPAKKVVVEKKSAAVKKSVAAKKVAAPKETAKPVVKKVAPVKAVPAKTVPAKKAPVAKKPAVTKVVSEKVVAKKTAAAKKPAVKKLK